MDEPMDIGTEVIENSQNDDKNVLAKSQKRYENINEPNIISDSSVEKNLKNIEENIHSNENNENILSEVISTEEVCTEFNNTETTENIDDTTAVPNEKEINQMEAIVNTDKPESNDDTNEIINVMDAERKVENIFAETVQIIQDTTSNIAEIKQQVESVKISEEEIVNVSRAEETQEEEMTEKETQENLEENAEVCIMDTSDESFKLTLNISDTNDTSVVENETQNIVEERQLEIIVESGEPEIIENSNVQNDVQIVEEKKENNDRTVDVVDSIETDKKIDGIEVVHVEMRNENEKIVKQESNSEESTKRVEKFETSAPEPIETVYIVEEFSEPIVVSQNDIVITSNEVVEEKPVVKPRDIKTDTDLSNLPCFVLGRNMENPQEDFGSNGRTLPRPRFGVKVPYLHLKSQIVSKQELDNEIIERVSNCNPDPPAGGDIFFARKLTQRLASKIALGSSQFKSKDPTTKINIKTETKGTPSSSSKTINDKNDLLAILEGDGDVDWAKDIQNQIKKETDEDISPILTPENFMVTDLQSDNTPSKLQPSVSTKITSSYKKPPSEIERIIALKQLETFSSRSRRRNQDSYKQIEEQEILGELSKDKLPVEDVKLKIALLALENKINETNSAKVNEYEQIQEQEILGESPKNKPLIQDVNPQIVPLATETTPVKVIKNPAKIIETPAKVIENVAKVFENPEKVIKTPAKIIENPEKIETPAKVIEYEQIQEREILVESPKDKPLVEDVEPQILPIEPETKVNKTTAEKVIENLPKVIENLPKVIENPPKVIENPPKVIENPVKVIENPAKLIETPPKVIENLAKVIENPANVIENPPKVIEYEQIQEQEILVESPKDKPLVEDVEPQILPLEPETKVNETTTEKVIENPAKVIETLPEVIENLPKVIENPPKIIENPATVIENPAKVIEKPAKVIENPAKVIETPPKVIENLAKVIENPPKVIEYEQIEERELLLESPKDKPLVENVEPQILSIEPETKVNETTTEKVIENPAKVIETLPKVIENLPKVIENLPKVIENPPKVIENPPKVIENPPKVIENPVKVIENPAKVIETLPKVIENPPKVIENPPKVIENPPKVIESAAEVMEYEQIQEREILVESPRDKPLVEDVKPQNVPLALETKVNETTSAKVVENDKVQKKKQTKIQPKVEKNADDATDAPILTRRKITRTYSRKELILEVPEDLVSIIDDENAKETKEEQKIDAKVDKKGKKRKLGTNPKKIPVEKETNKADDIIVSKRARVIKKKVIWEPVEILTRKTASPTKKLDVEIKSPEKRKKMKETKEKKSNILIEEIPVVEEKPEAIKSLTKARVLRLPKAGKQVHSKTETTNVKKPLMAMKNKLSVKQKPRKTELEKLLDDEGAVNMLYQVNQKTRNQTKIPHKDLINRAELVKDVITSTSIQEDKPKALRKKASPKKSSRSLQKKKSRDSIHTIQSPPENERRLRINQNDKENKNETIALNKKKGIPILTRKAEEKGKRKASNDTKFSNEKQAEKLTLAVKRKLSSEMTKNFQEVPKKCTRSTAKTELPEKPVKGSPKKIKKTDKFSKVVKNGEAGKKRR